MDLPAEHISEIDHLVYACSDLEEGVRHITEELGMAPVEGGRHPAWGTHNALLGLGPRCYLEIIGPDPSPQRSSVDIPEAFTAAGNGSLTTWAARVDQLPEHYSGLQSACPALGGLVSGSRRRLDGETLSWVLTDPASLVMKGAVPFLIDWGDSDHPASGLARGCALRSLVLQHPEPGHLVAVLDALGLSDLVQVEAAPDAGLGALIETPTGIVRI